MLRRNKESGQALVFGIATLGILLIGMAVLGIDMGSYSYEKRLMQTAADAEAIAGASNIASTAGPLAALKMPLRRTASQMPAATL